MLKNLIGRLFGGFTASGLRASDPARWEAELLERVKEMTPNDPLIGAKVGGKELAARLIEAMRDGRGVHAESLMCAVGALAGYSCQATVRALNRSQGLDEVTHLVVASTDEGESFFFGETLNKYVAEDELSVWSLAAGGAARTDKRRSRSMLVTARDHGVCNPDVQNQLERGLTRHGVSLSLSGQGADQVLTTA